MTSLHMWFLSCTFTVLSADVTQRSCSALIGGFRIFYVAFKYLFLIQFTSSNNFTYNCLSGPMVIILFSFLFNACISGREVRQSFVIKQDYLARYFWKSPGWSSTSPNCTDSNVECHKRTGKQWSCSETKGIHLLPKKKPD